MEVHINSVHLGIKSHKCTLCDFQTATKSTMKHHINSKHLGQRNHKCSHCDYVEYAKSNLTKHINNVHPGLKITNVIHNKPKTEVNEIVDKTGLMHSESKEIANAFVKYFTNIGKNMASKIKNLIRVDLMKKIT
ncbi:hypothetical protein HHI36_024005 [Cryptolaemus montrouzieri]|uniref:C2H2-type domain-containing protein n=1 Tax=Cryptolaemus montrouzieri TaxID=559131 RepID=A0ABD2NYJ4_9CUCU